MPELIRRLGWIERWDLWLLVLKQASAGSGGVDPDVRAYAAFALARADGRKRAVVYAGTLMTGVVIAAVTRKTVAVILVVLGEGNRQGLRRLLGPVQWTENEFIA